MKKPLVGIIIGSESDFSVVEKTISRLSDLGIISEVLVASAHRTPDTVREWATTAEDRGLRVIIAAAGMAAHLPGVVASFTILPVIGIPVDASAMKGIDSLYSIVQMPPGIPVATVGINAGENAALLAAEILAITNPQYQFRLKQFRLNARSKVNIQNENVQKKAWSYRETRKNDTVKCSVYEPIKKCDDMKAVEDAPSVANTPSEDAVDNTTVKEEEKLPASCPVLNIDPVNPELSQIEKITDILLEGGVIGIPTDTVYGIICDATNQLAVQKIFEIKKRSAEKAIPIMAHNLKMIRRITTSIPEIAMPMIDDLWPGALTLILRKSENVLKYVSPSDTIGIRIPDNYLLLSLISFMERPIAATSANISGEPPILSAAELKKQFGDKLNMIIDVGEIAQSGVPSTIINLAGEPFKIIREGSITKNQIKEYLQDIMD